MIPTSTNKGAGRRALFPGSFNPFTRGHADIVARGLDLFDHIVIGVGVNRSKGEGCGEEYAEPIRRLYKDNPRVSVVVYNDLTIDCARREGAGFLLRGVRSVKDYEYEREMAGINRRLAGIDSVILFSDPELSDLSSSVLRELKAFGYDIEPFLPH